MKKFFISLAMALSIVSCSTEELSSGGGNDSQKGVVQLVLSTDGFDVMGSRAVDESAIHDINILEYIGGTLSQVVYLNKDNGVDFSQTIEVFGLKELPATTMTETTDANGNKVLVPNENNIENVIFVVANYGKEITNTEDVPYYKDLKKLTMAFSGKTDMTNLPMTGFYYGGINATSTTQMNVTLQRAVAKVNFTLDTSNFAVGGKAPNQLVINSIKLCNVPGNITLYPCQDRPSLPINGATVEWNSKNGHTLFPTKEEMEAESGSVTYGDEQNQSSTDNTGNTYTYVAYIPENVRGSYTNITDNKDKRPYKCDTSISEDDEKDENKEKSYTHILVDLNYATSDGTAKNATYRIYLGGNSTGDMNLLRNTQYNITTFLYGANSADTRISVSEDETESGSTVLDPANCYMVDMDDVASGNNQLFIPLNQVTKGWDKIVEYDATQSDTKTKVDEMLKSGKWTIKTLWKTWDGPTNVKGTIAAGSTADNPIAKLNIPTNIKNGNNAVVELVSTEDNTVYWSWHLWFTDYKPNKTGDTVENGQVHQYSGSLFQTGGIYANKYIMDRYLGAIATNVNGAIARPTSTGKAIEYYGLFYQQGRKDPFVGSGNGYTSFVSIYDATGKLLNNTTSPTTPPFNRATGSASTSFLAATVNNPFTFYGVSSGKWTKENDLWDNSGTNKSVFDPCPPGWRVPINGTWADFSGSNFTWSLTATGTAGRMYTNGNVNAWYPACGSLNYSSGALGYIDYDNHYYDGAIWCTTLNAYWNFGINFLHMVTNSHATSWGFNVRCIQE